MADQWEQYAAPDTADQWEQYAAPDTADQWEQFASPAVDTTAAPTRLAARPPMNPLKRAALQAFVGGIEHAPEIGGLVGGFTHLPFAAGMFSVPGEVLRQSIVEGKEPDQIDWQKVGLEAGKQQVSKKVGDVIGGTIGVVGRRIASANKLRGVLAEAGNAGKKYFDSDFLPALKKTVDQYAKSPTAQADLAAIERMWKQLPKEFTPQELQSFKQMIDSRISGLYDKLAAGKYVPPGVNPRLDYYREVVDLARKKLEEIPGVSNINKVTKGAIDLQKALTSGIAKRFALPAVAGGAAAMTGGTPLQRGEKGIGAALAAAALTNPALITALLNFFGKTTAGKVATVAASKVPQVATDIIAPSNP